MSSKKLNILVTGSAGFIGFHLCKILCLNKNNIVTGIDNINNYYDQKLKKQRLTLLKENKNFTFYKIDLNSKKLSKLFQRKKFDVVINLAAQAGVRYSIENPKVYFDSNISGFFNILENCREYKIKHLMFASTSSVYGSSKKFPLKEEFSTDKPQSFYAASKKTNEIMAYAYSEIYKIPTTALRFFTVYGPYGRPDMFLYKYADALKKNKIIKIFNKGNHIRDFTYVDDVVHVLEKLISKKSKSKTPFQVLNIAGSSPKHLKYFIKEIENNFNKIAKKEYLSLQKGDVYKTYANTNKLYNLLNFKPNTSIKKGISEFVKWFKNYK